MGLSVVEVLTLAIATFDLISLCLLNNLIKDIKSGSEDAKEIVVSIVGINVFYLIILIVYNYAKT